MTFLAERLVRWILPLLGFKTQALDQVRDWWAKLTGGADDEELDSTTDPEQTSIERRREIRGTERAST